jgi:hypothetical protein
MAKFCCFDNGKGGHDEHVGLSYLSDNLPLDSCSASLKDKFRFVELADISANNVIVLPETLHCANIE